MTLHRRQQCPELVNAIRNSNMKSISAWAAAHGIDHKFDFVTSDLLTESVLLDATILNVSLLLRNEQVALWCLRNRASHNIPMWRVVEGYHADSGLSEREQHPLMVALLSGLPKAAKVLHTQGADPQFREKFIRADPGATLEFDSTIAELIAENPQLSQLCIDNGLECLVDKRPLAAPVIEERTEHATQDMFSSDMFAEPVRTRARLSP